MVSRPQCAGAKEVQKGANSLNSSPNVVCFVVSIIPLPLGLGLPNWYWKQKGQNAGTSTMSLVLGDSTCFLPLVASLMISRLSGGQQYRETIPGDTM